MVDQPIEPGSWYWDRRNGKAHYARGIDDDTVEFVTVWHHEEVADALDEVLVPIEEVGLDRTDTTFDLLDSFRFEVEEARRPNGDETEED